MGSIDEDGEVKADVHVADEQVQELVPGAGLRVQGRLFFLTEDEVEKRDHEKCVEDR
jgi:hypothetical protein